MSDLAKFIEENRNQALCVINKSRFRQLLDDHDIEEIIHCCLWRVFEKFNPERASLFRCINVFINSYILRIAGKKINRKKNECSIGDMDFCIEQESDITEWFTDEEWKSVSPLITNNYGESAKISGLSRRKYKKLLKSIANNITKRS